jgi:single stranded DNA-binding protein
VELRPLPSGAEVARLRVASGTRRRSGEKWVERTDYFTVEVYGPQANRCAERLGKGSRVVVDGELDWREWTDREQKRREAVVLRARQTCSSAPVRPQRGRPSPPNVTGRRMASLMAQPKWLRHRAWTTCRSDQAPKRLARLSTDGRAASPPSKWVSFFFLR